MDYVVVFFDAHNVQIGEQETFLSTTLPALLCSLSDRVMHDEELAEECRSLDIRTAD
jgi:hypothetical protein